MWVVLGVWSIVFSNIILKEKTLNNLNVVPIRPDIEIKKSEIGTVRWFNKKEGFGFICPSSGGRDVFVHNSELKKTHLDHLYSGMQLHFAYLTYEDGKTVAIDLRVLSREEHTVRKGFIKWFDSHKGYGFVRVAGHSDDIIMRDSAMLRSGILPFGRFDGRDVLVRIGPGSGYRQTQVTEITLL